MRLGLIGGELDHVLLAVGLGPVLKLAMPVGGIGRRARARRSPQRPGRSRPRPPARHAPILAGALGALPDLQHEEVAVQRASDQGGRIAGIGAVEPSTTRSPRASRARWPGEPYETRGLVTA